MRSQTTKAAQGVRPSQSGRSFQAARAGYNRKCLQALLAELEAGVAAAGRLVGGAADAAVFAELRPLGALLAPFPALARRGQS